MDSSKHRPSSRWSDPFTQDGQTDSIVQVDELFAKFEEQIYEEYQILEASVPDLVLLEGPNDVGKSTLGHLLEDFLGYTYYKNDRAAVSMGFRNSSGELTESAADANMNAGYMLGGVEQLLYALKFLPKPIVLDRLHLSEWVYSKLDKNRIQHEHDSWIWRIDKELAEMKSFLIVMGRSYETYPKHEQRRALELHIEYDKAMKLSSMRKAEWFKFDKENMPNNIEAFFGALVPDGDYWGGSN